MEFHQDIANVKKAMIFPDFNQKSHTKDLAILKLDKKMGLTMALNLHLQLQLTFPWIDQHFGIPNSLLECFTLANEGKILRTGESIVNFVPIKTKLLDRKRCIKCDRKDDVKWWIDVHNKCATINVNYTLLRVRLF